MEAKEGEAVREAGGERRERNKKVPSFFSCFPAYFSPPLTVYSLYLCSFSSLFSSLFPSSRAVDVLGGRLSDLEALIVRYKNGKSLSGNPLPLFLFFFSLSSLTFFFSSFCVLDGVNEMVDDARKDILSKGYGGKFSVATTGKKWTKSQLWRT